MKLYRDLYVFELKKIIFRKLTLIVLALLLMITAVTTVGDVLSNAFAEKDGGAGLGTCFSYLAQQNKDRRALDGQKIDDALLDEMQSALAEQTDAETDIAIYDRLYYWLWDIFGSAEDALTTDAAGLYAARKSNVELEWERKQLNEDERAYWQAKNAQVEQPLTYRYYGGWGEIAGSIAYIDMTLLMFLSAALSGVFSDEHTYKTDQLILCTRMGKHLYPIKLLAGLTVGLVGALVLFGFNAILCFALYGMDGASAALQMALNECPRPITVGQGALILFFLLLAAGLLYSVLALFLSQCLKSSVATICVMMGYLMATIMLQPNFSRIVIQLWMLLPLNLVDLSSFLDGRLVPFFGGYLNDMQAAPLLYLLVGIVLVLLAKASYERYQVTGR